MLDYIYEVDPEPPRFWDLREWYDRGVYMPKYPDDHLYMYQILRYVSEWRPGTIVIIPSFEHNYLARLLDYTKVDVRTERPYFYDTDDVDWRII